MVPSSDERAGIEAAPELRHGERLGATKLLVHDAVRVLGRAEDVDVPREAVAAVTCRRPHEIAEALFEDG